MRQLFILKRKGRLVIGINNKAKAQELADLRDHNSEYMGENAAYALACSLLGIDPDDGYELLELIGEKKEDLIIKPCK